MPRWMEKPSLKKFSDFYCATACNATHGIAKALLTVCLTVCLSVRPSIC